MSLLLDARKKLQQAQQDDPASHAGGTGPSGQPESDAGRSTAQAADHARHTGRKLFAAKLLPMTGGTLPNRNLLYALGITLLLLAAGMAYLWHVNTASSTAPLHPATSMPTVPPSRQIQSVAATEPAIQNLPAPAAGQPAATAGSSGEAPPAPAPMENASSARQQPRNRAPAPPASSPVRVERPKTERVDPLLSDAYLAYRGGRLGEARQMYLSMLAKDARNPDVLLGLAAIAQQRGENQVAARYFGLALALDPRNAAANAGMSALNVDEDYSESRLKILLREQGDSAVLHFALGNLYAGQSRWSEAQQAYFNAYLLEPGNAEFAFNLAVSLDHLGQKKLAAQHYRHALRLDPSHSAGFDHAQISQRAQELAR